MGLCLILFSMNIAVSHTLMCHCKWHRFILSKKKKKNTVHEIPVLKMPYPGFYWGMALTNSIGA